MTELILSTQQNLGIQNNSVVDEKGSSTALNITDAEMNEAAKDDRKQTAIIIIVTATILLIILICIIFLLTEGIHFVPRREWNAEEPSLPLEPMYRLPEYVIISHTNTESCYTKETCSAIVKAIQNYDKYEKSWNDIRYNFLVGGEGNVYIARGFHSMAMNTNPKYTKVTLSISLIGNFNTAVPTAIQVKETTRLIDYGVNRDLIADDYKVLGQRQISDIESPGDKLYEIIQQWEHWVKEP